MASKLFNRGGLGGKVSPRPGAKTFSKLLDWKELEGKVSPGVRGLLDERGLDLILVLFY